MFKKRGLETLFISLLVIGTVFGGVVYGNNDDGGLGDDILIGDPGLCGESVVSEEDKDSILSSYTSSSTYFTENQGQFPDEVLFQVHAAGATVYLCRDSVVSVFTRKINVSSEVMEHEVMMHDPMSMDIESPQMEMLSIVTRFVNSDFNVVVSGERLLTYRNNYFIGNDPSKWYTDVPNYQAVLYKNMYPGIDLRYYSQEGSLKYDFIIQPGADPSLIRMKYEGVETMELTLGGELEITTKFGVFSEKKPVMYQEKNGIQMQIPGRYILGGGNMFGFTIQEDYNQGYTVVIDPELVYSTYLGGSSSDGGYGVAVDGGGNAYITGYTNSDNFPIENPYNGTYNGNTDVFVTKLSPSGNTLIYSTYLGGTDGDLGRDVAVDGGGNAYITGYTNSGNFPVKNYYDGFYNGNNDVFVTKLSPSGNTLIYSTYLGGTASDVGLSVAVDGDGNAYITGHTASSDFPMESPYNDTFNGNTDVFVTKLSPSGNTLVYSTYLGGTNFEYGYGVAVDGGGNAYITGPTNSSNFPVVNSYDDFYNGGWDVFVTKLSPSGNTLSYSTYLGGTNFDYGYDVAVDGSGNAYITGYTNSGNFPVKNYYDGAHNGNDDVFVTKLSPSGNTLVYSTYLGGTASDVGWGIVVDGGGNAYITGHTASSDFPMENPYNGTFNGEQDVFVTKLSPSGSILVYSTYLGGTNIEIGFDVAMDESENAYVTGRTYSPDFPMENPYNGTYNGLDDVFVAKLETPLVQPTIDSILITFSCSHNEISDQPISTNFTLKCFASAFNDTSGFIGFINVNWTLMNSGSNASINSTSGESVEFFSGWHDGTATLSIDDGSGNMDDVTFTIDHSVFSMFIGCGWNLIGWWQDYDTDAPTLGQYIPSCKTVCRFRVETQMYQTHVVGIPYNEFTITRGMGLFIYTPTASIWDGTDGTQ